ncbi:MAG: hypothetical protein ACE5M4_10030 [Anaerolineales bacterium]
MKRSLKPEIRARYAGSVLRSRQLTGKEDGVILHFSHNGGSMRPFLRDLDLLEIIPYGDNKIDVGDVIAFMRRANEKHIVHRVVGVDPRGINTRGDNNPHEDPWLLDPTDITGKVVAVWRGHRERRVAGGLPGRIQATLARAGRPLDRSIGHIFRPFYNFLVERGIVRRLLPSSLKPRVVSYRSDSGRQLRLQYRRRIIGEFNSRSGQWSIRRPYRLLVDENALPSERDIASGPL